MLEITFTGINPSSKTFNYGVADDNQTRTVRFLIDKTIDGNDLSTFPNVYVKVGNLGGSFYDKIAVTKTITATNKIQIDWNITRTVSDNVNVCVQVQFENIVIDAETEEVTTDKVFQLEHFDLFFGQTIPADEAIEEAEPTIIQSLQAQIVALTTLVNNKQAKLVSGENIKTIDGQSILGSGNLTLTGGIFACTYGTTTYSEIATAISNSKLPFCIYNNHLYTATAITSQTIVFSAINNLTSYNLYVNSNGWSYGDYSLETTSNKVSSWQTTPDNTHYPAEKLVKDSIDAVEASVEDIEALIPNQASSSNQLADKDFVNSSISTETANFRGTSATGLTEEQFLAWADTLTKTNNDYCYWNTTDSAGNTLFKKYKYSSASSAWIYEYTLNNSSFTANQWASINSGISSQKVTNYDNHLNNTSNPHGVTKNQVGLGNVDNTADVDKPISNAQQTALNGKQATLVGSGSGQNIKTINGTNVVGSGNIDTKELFVCTYGATTYAEITTALTNGKIPVCSYDNKVFVCNSSANNTHRFSTICGNYYYYIDIDNENTWSNANTELLPASRCTVQTTAPTASISDGGIHLVFLSSAPAVEYNGWIYLTEES